MTGAMATWDSDGSLGKRACFEMEWQLAIKTWKSPVKRASNLVYPYVLFGNTLTILKIFSRNFFGFKVRHCIILQHVLF